MVAERVRVDLVDDIDQSDAAEKVFFALDGKDYEIDLSAAHASALREALAVYVAHGRPVSRKGRGAGAARRQLAREVQAPAIFATGRSRRA